MLQPDRVASSPKKRNITVSSDIMAQLTLNPCHFDAVACGDIDKLTIWLEWPKRLAHLFNRPSTGKIWPCAEKKYDKLDPCKRDIGKNECSS